MPPKEKPPVQSPVSSDSFVMPPAKHTGRNVVLIILLVIVVGGIAGGAVWYMQQKKLNDQKAQYQQQISDLNSQLQQLQKDNAAMKAQLAVDVTIQAAISKTIKGFYDDWLKGISATPPVAKATLATNAANKGYITQNVVTYINAATGSDPVVCAQNVPQSYNFANLTLDNKIAGAVVSFTFSGEGANGQKATLELVPNGTNWQISKITCK